MKPRQMKQIAGLAVAALCLLAAGTPTPTHAGGPAPAAGTTVPCNTPVLEGGLTCYAPRGQYIAEARLAVRPVDPVAVVRSATRLSLTQLRLFTGFQGDRGVNLLYGFGQVCWKTEFFCNTRYLVVGEAPGPSPFRAPRLVRDKTIRNGVVTYGPWKFIGPVSGRNLVVSVYGSFPRTTIRAIGERIIHLGAVPVRPAREACRSWRGPGRCTTQG